MSKNPETIALHGGDYRSDPATTAVAVPLYRTTSYQFNDTGHAAIIEQGSSSDVTLIDLAGSGHYDGSAGLIKSRATNATATSGDMELSCQGTSGFVLIEFKKDENYTS